MRSLFFSVIPPGGADPKGPQRKDCGSRAGLPAHAYQCKIGFIALLLHGLLRRCAMCPFVRILRRYCNLPKDADERALGAAAQKTVQEEGYEADLALVSVRR